VLEEYCRQHPDVQPDVVMEDRIGNWVEDRVDVGFRIGRSAEEGVVARRLFTLQLIMCASPDYLARHGAPENLDALASHRCSVFRHPGNGKLLPWQVKVGEDVVRREVVPSFSSNEEELETQAVLAGQVVGLLTSVSAAAHLRAGRLVPLLTRHVADHLGIYIYYGSRSSQPSRVRAFIDLAVQRLAGSGAFELSEEELASAEANALAGSRRASAV